MRALVTGLVLVLGCKGGGDKFDQILADLEAFKTRMCACTDLACADAVLEERRAYRATMRQKLDKGAKPTAEQDRRGKELENELDTCRTALQPLQPAAGEGGSGG